MQNIKHTCHNCEYRHSGFCDEQKIYSDNCPDFVPGRCFFCVSEALDDDSVCDGTFWPSGCVNFKPTNEFDPDLYVCGNKEASDIHKGHTPMRHYRRKMLQKKQNERKKNAKLFGYGYGYYTRTRHKAIYEIIEIPEKKVEDARLVWDPDQKWYDGEGGCHYGYYTLQKTTKIIPAKKVKHLVGYEDEGEVLKRIHWKRKKYARQVTNRKLRRSNIDEYVARAKSAYRKAYDYFYEIW